MYEVDVRDLEGIHILKAYLIIVDHEVNGLKVDVVFYLFGIWIIKIDDLQVKIHNTIDLIEVQEHCRIVKQLIQIKNWEDDENSYLHYNVHTYNVKEKVVEKI